MKLAYMYATPDVTHSEVTAVQGDMAEVLFRIKKMGYTGVEFLVRDPRELDQKKLRNIVRDLELDVPAICTGEVYGEDMVSFADSDSRVRKEAIDRMKACLQMAETYDSMVNVGRLRGRFTANIPKEMTVKWVKEAIIECAEAYPHVPIVMEPVNRNHANYLLTAKEMHAFVKEIDLNNVGIMLDLEHMLTEGEILSDTIQNVEPYFWHFHVCDSNRFPPGVGDYDFNIIMMILKQFNYNKYITIESFQKPNSSLAIERSYQTLKSYFE
ncbi:hypothetical protein CIL05_17075 [Virgibacillus profundi]|uniref:Xylose isomerase-like TIM barrel domain-containing protein n=1 Tax=Virgibacillus profundi TaxID=2024555 RepID=A0A2A2I9N4_9BACI|nr:sugar phosphate isomerase/epimerase family protein [Virgibacillus profundi]PAV28347.1 hypothetical protein CIL05_17075 [Virgibacillus profundi]PXY52291.1 sugar phosphate isomerase/epimerase [Virgibacillus profundi]